LQLGIRPEHFDAAGAVKVSMPIDVIEHLGGSSFAYSRSEMELPLTIEIRENRNVREGEVFQTGFNPQRAFLFDAATGARLR
jgi:lactose/L-arabinose transport system ATP-binding protein